MVCVSCVHWIPHHLSVMSVGVCDGGHAKRIASCCYNWKMILSVSADEELGSDYNRVEERHLIAWEPKREVP